VDVIILLFLLGVLLAPLWLLAFIVWGLSQICSEMHKGERPS